jgi:hypothetical protein
LFEWSVQDKLIWLEDTAVAVRFVGAAGVGIGVAVGLGVGVGLGVVVGTGVDVGVAVGLGVGVDVEVGLGVGVVVAAAVGVGLGMGVAQRLVVSAFATFEYPEFPTLLYARTRKYLSPENLRLLM